MNLRLDSIQSPLAQFTLSIDATLNGRVTALFGESGAGKTTLLEIIAGLRRPVSGTVALDAQTLTKITPSAHHHIAPNHRAIGYLPQEGSLFPHLSVRQNLLYGTHATRHEKHPNLSYEHITEILEIAPLAERRINTLSGGEKQRVALGRALLSGPRLLLLDEPLAGLGVDLKRRLIPYFLMIRDELRIPMIYVTHSADEVMALCDDVVILSRGRVTQHAPPSGLFEPSTQPQYTLRT